METIGKVLSLTLLTIFGSAAAAVYLVDSDFFPAFLEKTPIVYTSDTNKKKEEPIDERPEIANHSESRKLNSETYFEVSSVDNARGSGESDAIWGQSYNTAKLSDEDQSDRAVYLASVNSLSSLKESVRHWNAQYKRARSQGQSRTANLAYSNYKDYKKAIEIKTKTKAN